MGYAGANKHCQNCLELFQDHLVRPKHGQARSSAQCSRQLPCDGCRCVLLQFDIHGEELWERIDLKRLQNKRKQAEGQSKTKEVEEQKYSAAAKSYNRSKKQAMGGSGFHGEGGNGGKGAEPVAKGRLVAGLGILCVCACVVMFWALPRTITSGSTPPSEQVIGSLCGNWFRLNLTTRVDPRRHNDVTPCADMWMHFGVIVDTPTCKPHLSHGCQNKLDSWGRLPSELQTLWLTLDCTSYAPFDVAGDFGPAQQPKFDAGGVSEDKSVQCTSKRVHYQRSADESSCCIGAGNLAR